MTTAEEHAIQFNGVGADEEPQAQNVEREADRVQQHNESNGHDCQADHSGGPGSHD